MADSQDLTTDYADSLKESIDTWMRKHRKGKKIEEQGSFDFLVERPLEIVRRVGAPFSVLLTYGGPGARVECELDAAGNMIGGATLTVVWGSGEAVRRSTAITEFAQFYIDLTEG